ncbi:MAG: sensor histidine kinase [Opitutae bacterium]|nr:sensor histidine kinase [Opitutae bacterium]
MPPAVLARRFDLFFVLVLTVTVVGVLMLGVAGDRAGMHALPEGADATVEVLHDPVASFTFAQALAQPAAEWRRWSGPGYIQSFYGEAVWVKFVLRNTNDAPQRGVLADAEYYTDRIDLWTSDGRGGWNRQRAGEWVPAAEKSLWGRDAAFLVEVPAHGERVCVMRLEDHFGVWLRPVWWPEVRVFLAAQTKNTVVEACYFGILLALLVYNGVLGVRLRHRDIGWYLGYLGAAGVFMFFWRSEHQVFGLALGSPVMETCLMLGLAGSGFCLVQFARVFLELPQRTPRLDFVVRVARSLTLVLAAGAPTMLWVNNTIWLHFVVGGVAATHVVLFVAAGVAWRAGAAQARYFVLSFALLTAGAAPAATIWLLSLPLNFSARAIMMGSAVEMLLLSLALADRFARLQEEKIAAQQRAMAEAEQRHAMQEAYADELEFEVRERTRELEAANADKDRMLAVLGHDLRGPLSGLTQTAEHLIEQRDARGDASFPRDVAGTGRALLLLIEDLVLWARLRAGTPEIASRSLDLLVAPAVTMHRSLADRARVELQLQLPAGLRVETDLVLAQTLVRNLIGNAVKHARTRVIVSASATAGGVQLVVSDDGPGLPAEVAARLQDDGAVFSAGGLGLRLCREICRQLNVPLSNRAAPGGGAEFGFVLPAAREARQVA